MFRRAWFCIAFYLLLLSTSAQADFNLDIDDDGKTEALTDGLLVIRHLFGFSGNSYSINRIGNTTYLNGSNASTGSTWSQTSSTWSDTTYHSGRAADGNAWNSTQIRGSYGTSTYGTDSRGRSFSSFEINSDPYSLYD